MGRRLEDGSEARFAAYVEGLASVIGHGVTVLGSDLGGMLPGDESFDLVLVGSLHCSEICDLNAPNALPPIKGGLRYWRPRPHRKSEEGDH
jgi:hypothetical protein